MTDDGVKRGGRHAIIDADEEQKMRGLGMPVRCCDYWPECSHVLAWLESREVTHPAPAEDGESHRKETEPSVP